MVTVHSLVAVQRLLDTFEKLVLCQLSLHEWREEERCSVSNVWEGGRTMVAQDVN